MWMVWVGRSRWVEWVGRVGALGAGLWGLGGCGDDALLFPKDVGCTVIVRDGEVERSGPEVCAAGECSCEGACADVVERDGEVLVEACYGADADDPWIIEPSEGAVSIDEPEAELVLGFEPGASGSWGGDLNINAAASVEVIGHGRDESRIRGNVNVHSGNFRLRGVTIEGDLSLNASLGGSSLAHCRILGNLNVHVPDVDIVNCEVFGNANINRDRATLVGFGVGGQLNLHGGGHRCEDVFAFEDVDRDRAVGGEEPRESLSCR